MKILTEIYRTEGLDVSGITIHRTAVRAVILRGPKLFMVHSTNVGDYKFPGGGVDAGETHEHALSRELLEECGATLLRVNNELGAIIEYDVAKEPEYDLFKMSSCYYFCQIGDTFGAQNLDDYEHDLGFLPVWIDMKDAIEKNRLLLDIKNPPQWLKREIFALEYIQRRVT
ncbi:MAG TPA: NUDIX domain-containing protein [Anaerolineales bacterium]|nr:NUDIX domain-containing protein [Anaerolineales bacterium]